MVENEASQVQPVRKRSVWPAMVGGVVIGMILCAVLVFSLIPSMMIVTKECKQGFDETVAELTKRIPEQGWVISGGKPMDMNAAMAKNGVEFKPRVKLIKLCKAEYAKSVLTTDRYVSCLMPCSMAVWEGDDGKVYLSEMNMGLMAKMFGGNVGKVMGVKVVKDESAMLEGLLKE